MRHPRVLTTVINWRRPQITLECLKAIEAMEYPGMTILVIDNGSGDDSLEILNRSAEGIEVVALPANVGFAAGSNVGLRKGIEEGYEYVLLMNNDAFPAADMLERLLAESGPDIALLSPKIYYETDPSRLWFGNGRQDPATLDLRETGRGELDGPTWSRSREVDYLLGTCLLVNLAIVSKVGLFDEKYFMYFEDLEWSLRLRQAGYRLRLVADAHLFHRVAVSTGGTDSALRRYHLARSSVIFWRRHARLGRPGVILLFRLASAVKMVARLVFSGRPEVAAAYLRGLRDGWRLSNQGGADV